MAKHEEKMNGQTLITFFTVTTIFLGKGILGIHAVSLTDTCNDCLLRARKYYSKTVLDPEQFCINNHLCIKTERPTFKPSEFPTNRPSRSPSSLPTFSPTERPTYKPSELPTNKPSHSPSSLPTSSPSELPSDGPLLLPRVVPSAEKKKHPADESSFFQTNFPTVWSTISGTDSSSTEILQMTPSGMSSDESKPPLGMINNRTTISSLFLKNLTRSMNHEVTEDFSTIALEFLKEYSLGLGLAGGVEFIEVKVVGQGPELGNSTEFGVHIDGIHIFFETIAKSYQETDIPRLIEIIFKRNRKHFFARLIESNEYFAPLGVDNVGGRESVGNQIKSSRDFLSGWVITCLSAVVGSVFITTVLIARMIGQNRSTGGRQDVKKQDTHPLYSMEQISSYNSTETNKIVYSDSEDNTFTKNSSVDILQDLDHSLVGLKLLNSQDSYSAKSSADARSYKKQNYEAERIAIETVIDANDDAKGRSKTSHDARMRKRQIEQDFKKRKSSGTSMGAILIATSSFQSDEESGEQRSGLEDASDQNSNHTWSESILHQISTVFRTKKKKQKLLRLEPVQIIEEDDSDSSCLSTPVQIPNEGLSYFNERHQNDKYDEEHCLSINTDIANTTFSKKISRTCPSPIETHFVSSPISKRLQRSRATTQPTGHYQRATPQPTGYYPH